MDSFCDVDECRVVCGVWISEADACPFPSDDCDLCMEYGVMPLID
jgi:hypothetical protein